MKLKSRILGISAAAVMATGLVAGAAYAGPPTARTGDTVYNGPQNAVLGACTGLSIGAAKSPVAGVGLTAQEGPYSIGLKGYPFAAGDYGSCTLNSRLHSAAGTGAGVTSLGIKLASQNGSCYTNKANPSNTTYPNTGQIKLAYGAGSFQGYITVAGFDTVGLNKVWIEGIISKGDMAGHMIGGNSWFLPALKVKTNPTGYLGGATFDDATLLTGAGSPGVPLTPNYGTSFNYTSASALGCSTGGDANITTLAVGAGVTDPVLGTATDGIQILG